MINDIITWKCLRKLCTEELQDVVGMIEDGEVDYNQPGWEDVYPTNDNILEFWREARLPIKAGKSELDLHDSFTERWRTRIRQAASKVLCDPFYSKAEAIKRGSALRSRKK